MKNIFLITKREFLTQVRKKSFVVLTLLAPLLMVGLGVFISYLLKANESHLTVNVIDKSHLFSDKLKAVQDTRYILVPEQSEAALKSSLKDMPGTDGLLIIPELENNDLDLLQKNTRLIVNKKIGFDAKEKISADLLSVVKKEKIKKLGLREDEIKSLDEKFDLKAENIAGNDKEDSDMVFGVKSGLSMLLMYATFMFIIIYGVRVMRSVLEEKNNRVVEIIISSVKPFELMLGKIFGVTLVALTQFVVWIAMSVAAALFLDTGFSKIPQGSIGNNFGKMMDFKQMAAEISHTLLDLNFPLIILVFIIFFLLGYIFYSSMYAAIGSAVDNETETQQFTMFAIVPLMIGMYGSFTIMKNPDGPMAFWLSMVPFTSPVAMIARIPFGVPAWQIVLSAFILLGTTLLMVYIAAKIYRIGILMYGNKATLKEIMKWMRS